jgi:hypothetical protein
MKLEWRSGEDFWAGLMFLATGIGAMGFARNYPFGSTLSMGPGYFDGLVGLCLRWIIMLGLRKNGKMQGASRRARYDPLAVAAFILMRVVGRPALAAWFRVASRPESSSEVLFLAVFLSALSAGMFIWGLGLPYPLIKMP